MTGPPGILRVHQDNQALLFQIEGEATMLHSVPLRRYAEQALTHGITTLQIDLHLCTYMDSTFLGTLLLLKRAVDQRGLGAFALTCLSPQCQRLLRQMGLDRFYSIVTTAELPTEAWTELTENGADCSSLQHTVVQAHQELADLPGPAGKPFREVMQCLSKDLERRQSGQEPK